MAKQWSNRRALTREERRLICLIYTKPGERKAYIAACRYPHAPPPKAPKP